MPKLKHVVWDWNGTLLDDAVITYEVLLQIVDRFGGQKLSFEDYRAKFRIPVRGFYEEIGVDLRKNDFSEMSKIFYELYSAARPRFELHEEVAPILQAVARLGLSQSILSAHNQAVLDQEVSLMGIHGQFTEVVGALGFTGQGKIDRGIEWLSARSDLKPADIIVIGDTNHDAEVAHALGAKCILVNIGHQNRALLERSGVPVIETLAELPAFLS